MDDNLFKKTFENLDQTGKDLDQQASNQKRDKQFTTMITNRNKKKKKNLPPPVKKKKDVPGELARVNFELPIQRLIALKIKCAQVNKSIKEVMTEHVDLFLSRRVK